MRRRSLWVWGLLALLALGLTLGLASSGTGSGASSLGRGAYGWLAARLYLERRGATVEIRDTPFDEPTESSPAAVWVLACLICCMADIN